MLVYIHRQRRLIAVKCNPELAQLSPPHSTAGLAAYRWSLVLGLGHGLRDLGWRVEAPSPIRNPGNLEGRDVRMERREERVEKDEKIDGNGMYEARLGLDRYGEAEKAMNWAELKR